MVYQVYPRSFADADGDGIGDLDGVRSRMDYLVALGVDGVWLSACNPSPGADQGYDVADYTDIAAEYGGLRALDDLVAALHGAGMRLLMDLVPNHCSTEHPWFVEALAAGRGSPARARFLFRDGQGPNGDEPPNNWQSVFGGPAWARVTETDGSAGQWYLHLFAPEQADFDWTNPVVGDFFEDVLRFWFDRGVDGLRIDVAHGLAKDPALPDWAPGDPGPAPMWDQGAVHDIYRRWRRITASYPGRALTLVGEAWVGDIDVFSRYLASDELTQAFFFDLLVQPWQAAAWRASIDRGLAVATSTGAPTTWVLANHDVHRTVTRYGRDQTDLIPNPHDLSGTTRVRGPVDLVQGARCARAAALVSVALPGALYLYQGEELGLPEVLELPEQARRDPIALRTNGEDLGRDGCRVPLPWRSRQVALGFSPGPAPAASWLPQPAWLAEYAVDREERDPESALTLYRAALRLRRTVFPPGQGFAWLAVDGRDDVLAFRRGSAVCVAAFGPAGVDLPPEWGEVALSSAAVAGGHLPGESAAWLVASQDAASA